jgi:hypothetical protein
MPMSRKFDVPVQSVLVGQVEEFSSAQGDQFFGCREPTVVSHDAAHKAGSKKHVGALNQYDFSALFYG